MLSETSLFELINNDNNNTLTFVCLFGIRVLFMLTEQRTHFNHLFLSAIKWPSVSWIMFAVCVCVFSRRFDLVVFSIIFEYGNESCCACPIVPGRSPNEATNVEIFLFHFVVGVVVVRMPIDKYGNIASKYGNLFYADDYNHINP